MSQPQLKNKNNGKKLFVGRITPRKNSSSEINEKIILKENKHKENYIENHIR
jgi:hypothetical protein